MGDLKQIKIPIIIGVSGHRDISDEDVPQLQALVRRELEALMQAYPHSDFVMLNSIAAGADSICAEIGLELGMRLVCPLPFDEVDYCIDFTPLEYRTFKYLLGQAEEAYVVENRYHIFNKEVNRDDHYRSATNFVATSCFALLAVWDGLPPKKDACGTSAAVKFMQSDIYMGKYHWLRNSNNGSVIHVRFPRAISFNRPEMGVSLIEAEEGCQHALFSYIDTLNERLSNEDNVLRILKPGLMTDTHYDIYLSDNNDLIDHIIDNTRDSELLRKSLPGVRTYKKIKRIAQLEQRPEIAVIMENPEKIIPAIQEQAYPNSIDILEMLYLAKRGFFFNPPTMLTDGNGNKRKMVLSMLQIDKQIRLENPDEAFKGLSEEDILSLEINLRKDNSLDEFEYHDAEYKNEWLYDRLEDYKKWRFERLCKEDLI